MGHPCERSKIVIYLLACKYKFKSFEHHFTMAEIVKTT